MKVDWKATIRAIAPTLGTALGGPLGGTAFNVIADKLLGEDKTASPEKALEKMVTSGLSPDQITALKKADQDFEAHMRELDITEFGMQVDDTKSARAAHAGNHDVFVLACVILLGSGVMLIATIYGAYRVLVGDVKADPATISAVFLFLGTLVGYVAAMAQQVTSYFFGSSKGSNQKTEAMADAFSKLPRK